MKTLYNGHFQQCLNINHDCSSVQNLLYTVKKVKISNQNFYFLPLKFFNMYTRFGISLIVGEYNTLKTTYPQSNTIILKSWTEVIPLWHFYV